MKHLKTILPAAALVATTTVGGAALVSADTTSNTSSTSSNTQSTTAPTGTPPAAPDGKDPSAKDGGKITTDATVVAAVTQAVQAKSAGATIDRVAKLPDGSYLAFTVQNSQKVIVSLDASYNITSTKAVPANAPTGTPPSSSNSTNN